MKIFGPLFWAIMLILAGGLMLLKHIFNWQINVFGVLVGVFFVLLGISFITGPRFMHRGAEQGIFMNGKIVANDKNEANCIFSNATVDIDSFDDDKEIEINSIFGSTIFDTHGRSVKIEGTCAFGTLRFPDGSTVAFGDRTYVQEGEGEQVKIEANSVFGSLIIR